MLDTPGKWRRRLKRICWVVLPLVAIVIFIGWYKFLREVPEDPFGSPEEHFKYGSIGSENAAGIPYWIWVAMPRVCASHLPGPGGYRSLGIAWEEGHEMPIGFTKKTIGFPRVANNCAVCHATAFRTKPNEAPEFVGGGPNHTSNIQGFLRFLTDCAKDDNFNADTLLAEIQQHTHLDWIDKLSYRFLIIPMTRKAILGREQQLAWMNRPGVPDWGAGRDDPMNLTKYFMTTVPVDSSVGQADFPSAWNLRFRQKMNLNWGGETPSPRSVIIDSALGLSADPRTVLDHERWIEDFLNKKEPPKYRFSIDQNLAGKGSDIYQTQCASCHDLKGPRTGTVIDIAEVRTDRNRLDTWTAEAARIANQKVASLGIQRIDLIKTNGYQAVPLDGLWLRAPYLHNGSVPSLVEMLMPEDKRSREFCRGYDLYDPVNVGFDSKTRNKNPGDDPCPGAFFVDTKLRGNGNQGHLYGTNLSAAEKAALIEYLKTL